MDICQQYFHCSETYTYVGPLINHICRDYKERFLFVSPEQLLDSGFPILYDTIRLPFVPELSRYPFLHRAANDSSNEEAIRENRGLDAEQPPVQTCISGTPHLDNCLAGKPIDNWYFNILNEEIGQWSLFSCE